MIVEAASRFVSWTQRLLLATGVAVRLSALSEPLIIQAMTLRKGSVYWTAFYNPMMWGLKNSLTQPIFAWCFIDVWDCQIEFL